VIHSEAGGVTGTSGGALKPGAAPVSAVTPGGVTRGNTGVTGVTEEVTEASLPVTSPPGNENFLGDTSHGSDTEVLPKIDFDAIEWEEEAGHE